MHEASLAQRMIEDIGRRIEEGEIPGRVRTVHLTVGRLTAVVPENLRFIFQILARGSVLEGARLEIEQVPIRASCACCGAQFDIENVCFWCTSCSSPDVHVLSGTELIIQSVEVD